MLLKYHQATYDLLTQKPIDRQKGIEQFNDYIESRLRGKAQRGLSIEDDRVKLSEEWADIKAWTTLDLYQRPVQFSEANIQKLDALEQQYKVKLPAAVREWYSLDIVPEIMSVDGWGFMEFDEMKPITQLGADWLKHVRDDLWYFLHAEYIDQGGEYLVCQLGVGDNPPVFAAYNKRLIELAPTFSEFIYLHFWRWHSNFTFDYIFTIPYHSGIKSMRAQPKFYRPLDHLRQHYSELKSNLVTYFYDDHTRITVHSPLVADNADFDSDIMTSYDREVMAGGEFRADSVDALKNIIHTLWQQDIPIFNMNFWDKEVSELVNQLRRETLLYHLHRYDDWVTESVLAAEIGASNTSQKSALIKWLDELVIEGVAEAYPANDEDGITEKQFRAKR